VSHAGLLQAASLWQRLGMPGVVRRGLRLPGSVGANSDAKVATVVMGMLAGADSIDDLGVLRSGATGRLLGAAKAPSTIGTWLRSFTYGHLRQLDAIARQLLLVCWAAGAGPHRLDELLYLDLDSTVIETHGLAKEVARVSEPTQPGGSRRTPVTPLRGAPGPPPGSAVATPPRAGVARMSWPRRSPGSGPRARPGRCWSAPTAASTTAGSSPAADERARGSA